MFTLMALAAGFTLGIFSMTHTKTFLLILFGVLPLTAYFSKYFIDIDPHYSFNDHKSLFGNIAGLIGEIPDDFRLGAILFLPAIIIGRFAWVIYAAKRKDAILDQNALDRKRSRILKAHGVEDWR